ncbi:SoxR reducing system RseC family protein [uncultured Megasphaera sp.]|uniref:SoxR reducing system RseC family protein n=1 Tax=uncultured Megasphaera sp. TaxID=165188 RepID=UPI00265A001F|nr:SoxR reducing system RseC family protein [uncultured Megasphaera sp.]
MRIGEGRITEILNSGLAKVQVHKDHLYVACSACFGADRVYVQAYNPIGAQEGQDVRYEIPDQHLIMSSFMCFIVPLILVIIGGILGYQAGSSVIAAVVGVVLGFVISLGIWKSYGAALGRQMDTTATITEVIIEEEE